MKDVPFGLKDNVGKLEKGDCDNEQFLSYQLPLLYFSFYNFKVYDI